MHPIMIESYFGKPKMLEEVKPYLKVLRDNIRRNDFRHINELFTFIENKFRDLINVEKITFFLYTSDIPNASISKDFGVEFFASNKRDNQLVKDENGIKFKNPKGKTYRVLITKKLLSRNDITEDEIIAILLHEMGHAVFWVLRFDLLKVSNAFYRTISNMYNFISEKLNKLRNFFGKKSIKNKSITDDPNDESIFFKKNGLRYLSERFADNFATAYGYGGELASALKKIVIENKRRNVYLNYNPFFSYFIIFYTNLFEFGIDNDKIYPAFNTRIYDQINKLKFELENNKNSLSQDVIDDINDQIKKMEEVIVKYNLLKNATKEQKEEFKNSTSEFIEKNKKFFIDFKDNYYEIKDYEWNGIL